MNKPKKIAVLMGGPGEEKDVSLKSGQAIKKALNHNDYDVTSIILDTKLEKLVKELLSVDLVFLGLHGNIGENGTIQGFLDALGIIYTGSGPLSSAICMDKNISKIIAKNNGIMTPKWNLCNTVIHDAKMNYPVIVKPNGQGSTVGLRIAHNESELKPALEYAFNYDNSVLVEEYIQGRELTVMLIDGKAQPVCEIIPSHEFYDYECKYTAGMSKYICPAEIDDNISNYVKKISENLFDLLKCENYSRADFRMDDQNKFWFLEMNTLPGMTDTSLAPMSALAAGISFNELIDKIVMHAWNNS
ncbi:MAG: D-alanine--D-alanine ligase [Candidatus Marinimicrobia bacterium]|nr:D-alanine--D-alanine ligase [Candidatus Neomarinimicrobiota bacterium]